MQREKQITSRLEELREKRQNWESFWQDLMKYCIPRKAKVNTTRVPGTKLHDDVYDSTAVTSSQVLAAGLHGYLTNPSSKWFSLQTQDKSLMQDQDVKMYFKQAEDKIFDVLNGSNFSQMIFETYHESGVVGTATLYEEEDEKDVVRFYSRPVREIFIDEDSSGRVNTVYRVFELTAIQAYERWGDDCSDKVKKDIKNQKYGQKYTFIHAVEPREIRDTSKADSKNFPFRSVYMDAKEEKIMSEKGYFEFPYFVVRFNKLSDETYGYSPAMTVWSDIRMINRMSKTIIRSAQKIVDPPIVLPHDGFLLPIKTQPNGINYRTSGSGDDKIEPLNTGANIPVGMEMEQQRREVIKQAFFVDLFLMMQREKANMTATEVIQRVEERMLVLGPILGRLMSELLDPIVTRTFNILLRKGLLPPPPERLAQRPYSIEYISPLAKAQKSSDLRALTNTLQIIGEMAQVKPEILDVINGDETVRQIADINGTNPKIINSPEIVQKIRQQRAEMQAKVQQMEMLKTGAETAEKATKAEKNLKEGR
jgi:hypothetical protein